MTDYTNTDIGEINTHRGREIHSIQTREREEERLNLLGDNDIDSNIWLKHRLLREREFPGWPMVQQREGLLSVPRVKREEEEKKTIERGRREGEMRLVGNRKKTTTRNAVECYQKFTHCLLICFWQDKHGPNVLKINTFVDIDPSYG